ncbi:MAG: complex I NDUFA9 subunit family protein [Armatimonadota bacterium]|jgi:NADH dehydrogenase
MILVTGATGFVGRHLVKRLRRDGHRVRCLVREGAERSVLHDSDVERAVGDVTDAGSLVEPMEGVEAVIHLVGIIVERGAVTFEAIHVDGTRSVVTAAEAAGVGRLLYVSALGTRPQAVSRYHQTKWHAEQLVRGGGEGGDRSPKWTIVRPSIIVGEGDGFTDSLRGLLHKGPVIPIAGSGRSRLQPIFIDDLTACIAWCLAHDEAIGQTYEVGGPEQLTFERIVDLVAQHLGVQKRKLHVPMALMFLVACAQEVLAREPEVTVDQLKMMSEDNICEARVLRDTFGIEGTRFEDGLKTFL